MNNVTMITHEKEFLRKWENYKEQVLVGSGIVINAYQAGNVNIQTGKLKQSMSYVTTDGKSSGISSLTRPRTPNTVKAGSNVEYARWHERYLAWCLKSKDQSLGGIRNLIMRKKGLLS